MGSPLVHFILTAALNPTALTCPRRRFLTRKNPLLTKHELQIFRHWRLAFQNFSQTHPKFLPSLTQLD